VHPRQPYVRVPRGDAMKCGGKGGGSSCGGSCAPGSCGPDHGDSWALPDDLIKHEPYDALYERCQCGGLGFFPETWDEFGPSITTATALHFRKTHNADCVPREDAARGSALRGHAESCDPGGVMRGAGGRPQKTICADCGSFVSGPRWRGVPLGTCLEDPPIRVPEDCPACKLWRPRRTGILHPVRTCAA
jgi:hypothetical protein